MIINSCPICNSSDLEKTPTTISDFVVDRISYSGNNSINLCKCKKCNMCFYDYRFSAEEETRLYNGYRGKAYQKTREKYECYYTSKVNEALNSDVLALEEQKHCIANILSSNGYTSFESALDYGGNEGATFFYELGTEAKYVYDISGIQTKPGIKGISTIDELYKHEYDFIMCNMTLEHCTNPQEIMRILKEIGKKSTIYYIEVPYEPPFSRNKFSIKKNFKLLFNPIYSKFRLVKHYFYCKKRSFMPMHEHINFFTEESIRYLCESNEFTVIDIKITTENGVLGTNDVLSILFKK